MYRSDPDTPIDFILALVLVDFNGVTTAITENIFRTDIDTTSAIGAVRRENHGTQALFSLPSAPV